MYRHVAKATSQHDIIKTSHDPSYISTFYSDFYPVSRHHLPIYTVISYPYIITYCIYLASHPVCRPHLPIYSIITYPSYIILTFFHGFHPVCKPHLPIYTVTSYPLPCKIIVGWL